MASPSPQKASPTPTDAYGGSGGGGGTVNSFSVTSVPAGFSASVANPTTDPALTLSADAVAANKVAVGPASGAAAAWTFRLLVDADIGGPYAAQTHTHAASAIVSGQVALARGGTALDASATGAAHAFVMQESAGAAFTVRVATLADVGGFGTNVATFLGTPSSANLAAAVTDETGSGALVFATSPTLVTPALGTPASGTMTNVSGTAASLTAGNATKLATARAINGTNFDGSADIVVGAIPQNSKSAAYTTVLSDAGKHILHPAADVTARTFTIDSNANVAYPVGTTITFVNEHGAGVVTIAITSDTMRIAGAGTTGSRTLAADGIATALKITSTSWIISGAGLT